VRIALGLEYDGAHFAGWQTQPDRSAVQDAVEAALFAFATEPVQVVCAGRTDTGVHATGQVVHLDTPIERGDSSWVRGVNRYLPPAAAVRWARPVPADFHARFSAISRTYDYWILNDPVRSPLHRGRAGWVFRPLDEVAMGEAAALLLGTHDFTSFRSAQCQARTPVRQLHRLEVSRRGRMLRVQVHANAFLHHMVRNLVGTLVWVGLGRRPAAWAAEVLAARDRSLAAPTFEAGGLYLSRVEYDPAFGLPEMPDPNPAWNNRAVPG
jgi:tRNA pseudouridine38-40 synthase